jgi:hypothetical protein
MDAQEPRVNLETPVPISVKDLRQVADLLSLAAERGAFGIADFEDVGGLYRRICAFLASAPGS